MIKRKSKISNFAERIVGQSMFKILGKAKDLEIKGKDLIHFEIGDSHLEMPTEVKKSAMKALYNGRTHYGDSRGEHILRVAIQKAVKEDFKFTPSLSQVVVTSGANPLIYYVMAVLVNPGEEVILTDPAFVTYNAVLDMLKIKGVHVPVTHKNNFNFSPKEIEKRITKKTRLIVINSPSNPTGAVYSESDIRKIYALAKKYNLYIYGLFRTSLLEKAIQFMPEVPGSDRLFMSQMALATRFRYVDRVLHIRLHHRQPSNVRLPNEKFNKMQNEDKWVNIKILYALSQMLYQSTIIPWYRKIYLPVALWRYGWLLLYSRILSKIKERVAPDTWSRLRQYYEIFLRKRQS